MALETVWTTRLYVHYAVSWFVCASIMYAIRYGMAEAADRLKPEDRLLCASISWQAPPRPLRIRDDHARKLEAGSGTGPVSGALRRCVD